MTFSQGGAFAPHVGQAFQPDVFANPVRLESLTYLNSCQRSRNDLAAGAGKSRISVHFEPGPGTCLSQPFVALPRNKRRAAHSAQRYAHGRVSTSRDSP